MPNQLKAMLHHSLQVIWDGNAGGVVMVAPSAQMRQDRQTWLSFSLLPGSLCSTCLVEWQAVDDALHLCSSSVEPARLVVVALGEWMAMMMAALEASWACPAEPPECSPVAAACQVCSHLLTNGPQPA